MKKTLRGLSLLVLALLVLGACQDAGQKSGEFTVTVDVDGHSYVYRYNKKISVGQFLEQVDITLNELDEVNPSIYTQLHDGIHITIARIVEEPVCHDEALPFEHNTRPSQALAPGEEQLMQAGADGTVRVCDLVTKRDGVEVGRHESSRVITKEPVDEILFVGSEPPDTLIPIEGVLTYLSGGQAMIIEGNTTALRPLTNDGFLDGRVFELSQNGRQLLYTRSTPDETDPGFSNELWAILDTAAQTPSPVQLVPNDVRSAQWVPGQRTYTVSYSTATPTTEGGGWRAVNDLYLMQLDPETGEPIDLPELVVPPNALGIYAYWGRRYDWSPDGTQLAWANGDSVGVVDMETGDYTTLLSFTDYTPLLARSSVWVPTLSWSDDGHLVTTVHGPPYGDESPENSIVFDTAVIDPVEALQINPFFSKTGIWTCPTYSPMVTGPDGNPTYYVAYFKARDPLNSLGTQYDLWVADSDGSNARRIFPDPERTGFRPDPEDGIAWSPKARQLAFIYQNNLWLYDFETGLAHPITSDGQASRPRWSSK